MPTNSRFTDSMGRLKFSVEEILEILKKEEAREKGYIYHKWTEKEENELLKKYGLGKAGYVRDY